MNKATFIKTCDVEWFDLNNHSGAIFNNRSYSFSLRQRK